MKKSQIIATIIFLIASCCAIFFSCGKAENIADGTWTGKAPGFKDEIEVSITTKDGKIVSADVLKINDSDFAVNDTKALLAEIVKKGSVSNVDVVSGATYTSKGIIAAVNAALASAKGISEATTAKLEDTETDVVIIGAGGAGLSAAVAAREGGASVIVLEKMPIVGGNTNYATGGLNASETSIQAKMGISDSNEQYIEDTMVGGKNINDLALVTEMVEKSAETVDWLIKLGADLTDVGKMAGSTNSRTHRPTGGAAVGAHLSAALEKAAKAAGADIRLNQEVTKIINENGKAVGVVVSTKDGEYTIKAKAVIVATGGFGANPTLVESYKPELKGFGTTNHAGATGDALTWAKDFNAALTDIEQIQTHPTVVPVKNLMITEAVRGNGAIMINRDGNRFCTEMATRDVMSAAILEQTGGTAYLMFDTSIRKSLKAIETYASQGLLTEGATVAELAQKLGIPEATLEKTVSDYNSYVANGNDPDFGRKASEMPRALVEGPYYVVEVGPAIHHTMGGLKINTKAEVIDTNGNVIPALYAAGEVTGGIHGANRLGGNAVADITVFGKIAGEQAAKYALGK
ncbi:MAG: flavocytochrome c [Spirochaetaceae bacterium]|nr:flavocytochrome c [Spirochaetaceae bacterium]